VSLPSGTTIQDGSSYSADFSKALDVGTGIEVAAQTIPPTVSISTSGGLTNQVTQTISGTVTAGEATVGATVSLYDSGGATAIGTATVGAGGAWSTSVTLSGDGTHSIVAKDTDAAGNTGSSSAVVFTVDTDGTEQAALALSFIDATILIAQSKLVHFSVNGLDPRTAPSSPSPIARPAKPRRR
jgi:hypothetical protein